MAMDSTTVSVGAALAMLQVPLLLRWIPPNPLYGLRTKATLADARVWYESNVRCGRDFLLLGCALVGLGLVPEWSTPGWRQAAIIGGVLVLGGLNWVRAGLLLRARQQEAAGTRAPARR